MDHALVREESGRGSWIMILGCPLPEVHVLVDPGRTLSGPSFVLCADCEHQRGINYEEQDPDADWSAQVNPERLKCGYCAGSSGVGGGHHRPDAR